MILSSRFVQGFLDLVLNFFVNGFIARFYHFYVIILEAFMMLNTLFGSMSDIDFFVGHFNFFAGIVKLLQSFLYFNAPEDLVFFFV